MKKWRKKRTTSADQASYLKKLQKIFLMNELRRHPDQIKKLLGYCHIEEFPAQYALYREGENSDQMYILLSGAVRIYKNNHEQETFLLGKLEAEKHSFFGEMSLIDTMPRSASVETETPVKLLVISRKNFIRLSRKEPAVAAAIMFTIARILARRLQKTNDDLSKIYKALTHTL